MREHAIRGLAAVPTLCAFGCYSAPPAYKYTPCDPAVLCCSQSAATTDGEAGYLPSDPGGPSPDGTSSVVLAISRLYYGDTRRDGTADARAWRQYGLNIDGKVTAGTSADVCTPFRGTPGCSMADGDDGIDNSFGYNLLPLITTMLGTRATAQANAALRAGDATSLVRLDALGAGADYSPLPGLLYHAAPTSNPRWDGTDARDVDVASLTSCSLASPILTLSGYMNGRTWVGTPAGGSMFVDLHLTVGGHSVPPLPITHVQIAMTIDPGNGSASSGILSGILAPDDAVAWAQQMSGWAWSSLCSPTVFDSIAQQIRQASDILIDGTNAPGQPCKGISVGLGFAATAVKLGQVVSLPTVPSSCIDGGLEAGDQ